MALKVRKTSEDMTRGLVKAWNAFKEASVASFFHADVTQVTSGNPKDLTVANDTLASANSANTVAAIKTSIATAASIQTYTTFNGSVGGTFTTPQVVLLTTSSNAGSYTASSTVVFSGTLSGAVVTDTLTLTGTDGGQTIYGAQPFDTITSIVVAAQANTGGAFQFGTSGYGGAVTLVNETKKVMNRHFADTYAHNTAVSAAVSTADASSIATAYALANALKAAYGTHLSASNVHFTNDSTNTIAAADATTIASLTTLVNEMKGDFNAHIISAPLGYQIELVDP